MKKCNFLGEKKVVNSNLMLFIGVLIFIQYILGLLVIENINFDIVFNQFNMKIIFNLILSIIGMLSCVVSYNSNKKQEIFMVALMYTVFIVDISLSKETGYLVKESIGYNAIITSFIRIVIIYISVSNGHEIKSMILKNKRKTIFMTAVISLISVLIEIKFMVPYSTEIIIFYRYYNIIISILYIIVSYKYFKKTYENNDYIYGVIANSMILFSLKAVCDYFYLNNTIKDIYMTGYSTIILAFIVYMIGIFIELNKSTNINKILDEKSKLFIKIIDENKHCNVVVCDENYKIQYKNKTARESFAYWEKITNLSFFNGEILDLEKTLENGVNLEEIETTINSKRNYRKDVYLKSIDLILDFSVHLLEINDKKFKVLLVRDISTKYELEKTLLEYEMIKTEERLKSEFFSNISHELRTPLNVIYSTKQLLDISKSKDDFVEVYTKYSETLDINCKRMLRLIDNIVDMTKLDVGHKEPNFKNYDIINVVEDMTLSVVNYAKTKKIEIIFDTEVEELNVKLDLDMLERIVLNLLSNAIKFSNENSTIFVKIFKNEKWVGIKVIDEGIGISPEIQHKIFDRFVQEDKSIRRKTEGSGIGLSLVKSFAEIMDGEVHLKSDGKTGSEFTVLLPNQNISEKGNLIYNDYNVDEDRVQVEFSDIYELFNT